MKSICPECRLTKDKRAVKCRTCADGRFKSGVKPCSNCLRVLPLNNFRVRTRVKPRPRSVCRSCEAALRRARDSKKPIHLRKAATRRWEKNNPGKFREQQIRRRCRAAGVSENLIKETVAAFKLAVSCEICKRDFSSFGGRHKTPCFDHCHVGKRFRGLICSSCNSGLGLFGDSPERLLAAAEYLKRR